MSSPCRTPLSVSPPSLSPPSLSQSLSSPRLPHTRPSPGSPSCSNRSQTSTFADLKRWQPAEPVVITGRINVYVTSERAASGTQVGSGNSQWSWGESLVRTAVNATVFGAALGLTAYRLLSTRAEPPAPITVHTEPQTATEAGQSTSRPLSAEYPPPPAYEELAKSFVLNDRDELESCHDVDDPELVTPAQSCTSTQRYPKSHSRTVSLSSPRTTISNLSGQNHRRRRSKARLSHFATRSIPSFTVYTSSIPGSFPHDDIPPRSTLPQTPDSGDEEDSVIASRLDTISERLKELIVEGQKALAAESPVISQDGWMDATPMPRDEAIEWVSSGKNRVGN